MKIEKTPPSPIDISDPDSCFFDTSDAQVALEWCAVLASQKIDFELSREGEVWLFYISPANFANAERHISEYEGERGFFRRQLEEIDSPLQPLRILKTLPFLLCSLLIFLFYIITGPSVSKNIFFTRGILSPKAFFNQGQWWRAITSLTLHANYSHVLGNCIFMTIFASIAGMQIGAGFAVFGILLTGILGNLSTLYLFGSDSYNSLGLSTAVFGALGIISMLGMFNKSNLNRRGLLRNWAPLAAGVTLLAFTGTAVNSDVAAHLFGFCWGLGVGGLLNKTRNYRDNLVLQGIFYVVPFAVVYYAWIIALKE